MQTAPAPKQKKWPAWAGFAIGAACVLAGAVGLVYFWRVVFYLEDLPALPFTLGVVGIGLLLLCIFWLVRRVARENISLQAALCILFAGLLFVFATAPLQVPDEGNHYLRAYAISQGRFSYTHDATYPDDVHWLFYAIGSDDAASRGALTFNRSVQYQGKQLAASAIATYRAGVASGASAPYGAAEPIIFMLLPFVPAGLAMALARLFGFSALGLLYAGRIANLLVYAAISYKALKNCDKYRGVFMAVAMLPLSLSLAASCSYDSLMLPLCFLILSYFCKAEITSRDILVLGAASLLVTYIKPMNLVLAAVILLVPKARWRTRWNPWLALAGVLGVALVFYFAAGRLDGSVLAAGWPQEHLDEARAAGADPAGQLAYILRYPFVFASIALQSVYEGQGFVFSLGTFGWVDLNLPLVSGLSVLSLCAASALGIQQKEDTRAGGAVGLLLAAGLYAGAILAGMYVLDTAFQAIRISGLQPRYFLPAILLLFMLGSILLGKAVRPRLPAGPAVVRTQRITLYIALGVALFAAVLLFQSYFIGQWIPKGDGGYKLVNLFGWRVL